MVIDLPNGNYVLKCDKCGRFMSDERSPLAKETEGEYHFHWGCQQTLDEVDTEFGPENIELEEV